MTNQLINQNKKFWNFSVPEIIFGNDILNKELTKILFEYNDLFIISNKNSLIDTKINEIVLNICNQENKRIDQFFVSQNFLSENQIEKAIKQMKLFNPSTIIAIGDEIAINCGKIAALKYNNPGKLFDFSRAANKFKIKGIPCIAIPDPSGLNYILNKDAVVFSSANQNQCRDVYSLISDYLLPSLIIIDPLYSYELTSLMTLSNSLVALIQALEAFISSDNNSIAQTFSAQSLKMICSNLIPAVLNKNDLYSRERMIYAALLANISHLNSMSSIISELSLPIYSEYHIPMGLIEGILLPHILKHVSAAIPKTMLSLIKLLDIKKNKTDSHFEKIRLPAVFFDKLLNETNIPKNLKELGVPKNKLNQISRDLAIKFENNPSFYIPKQLTKDDIYKILMEAYN